MEDGHNSPLNLKFIPCVFQQFCYDARMGYYIKRNGSYASTYSAGVEWYVCKKMGHPFSSREMAQLTLDLARCCAQDVVDAEVVCEM